MELDQKALDFLDQAKRDGFSFNDAVTVLREQGYDIEGPSKQDEQVESPGLVRGMGQSAGNAFAMGQGSRMAGVLNTAPGRVLGAVLNPLGTVIQGKAPTVSAEELSPETIAQQYQEGKQQFEQEQQAFEQAHPVANVISDAAGTIASLGIGGGLVRGGAAATLGAARMAKATQMLGKAGTLGARAVGEAATWGTYEGVRRGYGDGRSDFEEAKKGFKSGAILGGGLGVVGGAMSAAEPLLVKRAVEMGINPLASKLLGIGASAAVEGGALAEIPAALEDRNATAKDFATGVAMALGARGLGEGLAKLGGLSREYVTATTKPELEAIKNRADVVRRLNEITREEQQLKAAGSKDTQRIKQLQDERATLSQQISSDRFVTFEAEPSKEQMSAYLEANKKNKYVTPESARFEVKEAQKYKAAKELYNPEDLTTRQKIQKWFDNLRTQFNILRPIQRAEELTGKLSGHAVPFDKRASVRLSRLGNQGEVEALLKPVAQEAKTLTKENPRVISQYDIYASAKKRIQFKTNDGSWNKGETVESLSAKIAQDEQRLAELSAREAELKSAGAKEGSKELTDISAEQKSLQEAINQNGQYLEDLQKVAAYDNNATVRKLEESVNSMNKEALDTLRDSGLIDEEAYRAWEKNDSYVPTKKIVDFMDGDPIVKNAQDSFRKKYKGASMLEEGALESSMIQAKNIKNMAEINKAKQEYVSTGSEIGEATLENAGLDYKGGKISYNPKNQIVVWREGKPEIWNVPEKVATVFNPKPMQPETIPQKILSKFQSLYKGGTTLTSLGFSYSNLIRDIQGAGMMSRTGGYIDAQMVRESMKERIENTPIAQALDKELGAKTLQRTEQLRMLNKDSIKEVQDMMESISSAGKEGTPQGFLANAFNTILPKAARKSIGRTASKGGKGFVEALTYGGQLGEETTRLAVFKSVLKDRAATEEQYKMWIKDPKSIPQDVLAEAGNEAREVTLNFTRKMAPWVEFSNRYLLPYFKPSILGAMRGFEVLTNPEIAPRAWRAIINLGMLQGLITSRIGSKEDLDNYRAVNDEMKAKNFVFRSRGGKVYMFPLAQELGPMVKMFGLATEAMLRGIKGDKQRERMWQEAGTAAWEDLKNMVPAAGYMTEKSNWVIGLPLKIAVEQAMGKELFTNTPIEPEYMKQLPASMRYSANTSRTLIALSKIAADMGVEISPMRMQHLVKSTTSSTGKEWLKLSDYVLSTLTSADLRPKEDLENNPLIRRFVADIYAPYNQISQDVRDIIDDNIQGYKAVTKGMVKKGDASYERYKKQANIYASIKGQSDALTNLYTNRKRVLKALENEGVRNRIKYKNGELTKQELLIANDKAIAKYTDLLDVMKLQQRQLELGILERYKKVKKAPK